MPTAHRIRILGGGYAGMTCAIRLARRARGTGAAITLVDPSSRFIGRLRMRQLAAGPELAVRHIPDLLAGTGVEFVRGSVDAIDVVAKDVRIDTGAGLRTLHYDTLVYALGGSADTDAVSGVDVHAYLLDSPQAAYRISDRLDELAEAGGSVVVCGAGRMSIEAAAEIAEGRRALRVSLICPGGLGVMMGPNARAHLHMALDRLGVAVHTGPVEKVLPDGVRLADGELIAADATVWIGGARVPSLAAEAGIAVDNQGRVLVEPALRSVTHPDIYAAGAVAARLAEGVLCGERRSGAHVAESIARELYGREPRPFRSGHFHSVGLGRRDGVIQFVRDDCGPSRFVLTGRWAASYREVVGGRSIRLSTRRRGPLSRGGLPKQDAPTASPTPQPGIDCWF